MKLTTQIIKNLPVTEKRKVYWDSNNTGFGVRVAPTGLKTFVFMYRFQGKCQMLTIGRFRQARLEAMHRRVKTLKNALKKGEDPKVIISRKPTNGLTLDNAKPSEKILSDKEISLFWNGIERVGISKHIQIALKLMLFFGQTKKSILQTEWSHLDFEANIWTIQKKAKKELRKNLIPLLDIGSLLFRELPEDSQWVFPSAKINNGHLSETSIDQAIRYIRLSSNIPMLKASDIRRTIGINMVNSGVHYLIVKEILGFKTEDTFSFIGINQFPDYSSNSQMDLFTYKTTQTIITMNSNLKLRAFEWWHKRLLNILSIKPVILCHKKKGLAGTGSDIATIDGDHTSSGFLSKDKM